MQRWRGLANTPSGWGRCVVTIGVYDGVHRGHQQIISWAVERARELGLPSAVLTFDPHPSEVVRPGSHPPILTPARRKAELMEELGIDVFFVLPFTLEFSRLKPAEFVHRVLVEHLHAAAVVVGENFRFGHQAAGDIAELNALGNAFGFGTEAVALLNEGGVTISSTYVRSCIDAGDVTAATLALGRPHRIEGVVIRGDMRGRKLGFPTANLSTDRYVAIPADGVYAGYVIRGGKRLASAISVGTNPTFAGNERRVEAYVLDFNEDLYGVPIGMEFVRRLRSMTRFDRTEDLVDAIDRDVAQTRDLLT